GGAAASVGGGSEVDQGRSPRGVDILTFDLDSVPGLRVDPAAATTQIVNDLDRPRDVDGDVRILVGRSLTGFFRGEHSGIHVLQGAAVLVNDSLRKSLDSGDR